jgi:predicted dienelactone hydrolase
VLRSISARSTATAASRQVYGPFELDVAPDAEPLPGLRRLIVMSHGTGGSPLPDHALAATLVRAGFVVAQPPRAGSLGRRR